ncbi:DUF397 domain-containing protein [Streptomyces sp. NPDC046887]|uniref:DUF397 domain-containing protein n=1 Tax=Streptomyces sp. NPDC046887 TaxID=3155472 RepID=UPI0033CCADBB
MAIIQGGTDNWTKSSYSYANGACVEVRSPLAAAVAVRDSKVPAGPAITFPPTAWSAFVHEIAAR